MLTIAYRHPTRKEGRKARLSGPMLDVCPQVFSQAFPDRPRRGAHELGTFLPIFETCCTANDYATDEQAVQLGCSERLAARVEAGGGCEPACCGHLRGIRQLHNRATFALPPHLIFYWTLSIQGDCCSPFRSTSIRIGRREKGLHGRTNSHCDKGLHGAGLLPSCQRLKNDPPTPASRAMSPGRRHVIEPPAQRQHALQRWRGSNAR